MSGLLANACPEEPDALIALVRVCGGAPRVTGGSTRKIETADYADYADFYSPRRETIIRQDNGGIDKATEHGEHRESKKGKREK